MILSAGGVCILALTIIVDLFLSWWKCWFLRRSWRRKKTSVTSMYFLFKMVLVSLKTSATLFECILWKGRIHFDLPSFKLLIMNSMKTCIIFVPSMSRVRTLKEKGQESWRVVSQIHLFGVVCLRWIWTIVLDVAPFSDSFFGSFFVGLAHDPHGMCGEHSRNF